MFGHPVRGIPLASFASLLIQVNQFAQPGFRKRVRFLPIGEKGSVHEENRGEIRQHLLATASAGIVAVKQ